MSRATPSEIEHAPARGSVCTNLRVSHTKHQWVVCNQLWSTASAYTQLAELEGAIVCKPSCVVTQAEVLAHPNHMGKD